MPNISYTTNQWKFINRQLVRDFIQLRNHFGTKDLIEIDSDKNPAGVGLIAGYIGNVLKIVPLTVSDGPPEKRTFSPWPGDFRNEPTALRTIGQKLSDYGFELTEFSSIVAYKPDSPGKEIAKIIGKRSEIYKLRVKIPSELLGFNLDAYFSFDNVLPLGISFEVYDGGFTFPENSGILTRMAWLYYLPYDSGARILGKLC